MGALRCAAVVTLAAVAAAAQVREQVTVELIEVPVYVIGPGGQPLRGLTKEAFELRVNRRLQAIEYFDAIDFSAPVPKTATERPRRERRLYLLLFDRANSMPGFLARAQRAAENAVANSSPETDLFAVATYTANNGVQFAAPFLSDRLAIRRAIQTLSMGQIGDPLGVAISPTERADLMAAAPEQKSDDKFNNPELEAMLHGGAAMQEMQAQQQKYAIEDLLGNFGDLARRLAGLEGQKHVLYFSTGFRSSMVHGGMSPVPSGAMGSGGIDARSSRILEEMFRQFRAAGVFLDAVDIAGLRPTAAKLDPYENDSLQLMAHGTGGEFVHNRADLGNALNELNSAQQVVYILAFRRGDRRDGSIDVRVNGVPRGTRLSFRQGFSAPTRGTNVDPLELADILTNDIPQSGFDLKVNTSATEVSVDVPREQIISLGGDNSVVEVLLYVFDAQGSVVLARGRKLRPDAPMAFRSSLDVPRGHYVAKAVARLAGTAALGYARKEFNVP